VIEAWQFDRAQKNPTSLTSFGGQRLFVGLLLLKKFKNSFSGPMRQKKIFFDG